jgi:hypothetical protein
VKSVYLNKRFLQVWVKSRGQANMCAKDGRLCRDIHSSSSAASAAAGAGCHKKTVVGDAITGEQKPSVFLSQPIIP